MAFAKFGKGWSHQKCQLFNNMPPTAKDRFLYAIWRVGNSVQSVRAPIRKVICGNEKPEAPFPDYYHKLKAEPGLAMKGSALSSNPGMWFILSKQFVQAEIKDLRLSSNLRSLADVVAETRTSMMLVENIM